MAFSVLGLVRVFFSMCFLCWDPGKKCQTLLGTVVTLVKSLPLSGPQCLGYTGR